MPDELAVLADHPQLATWFGVLVLAGYALKLLAQASDTVAGLLGRLGKRWQDQKAASIARAEKARQTDNAQIVDMGKQLEHFIGRVKTLERRQGQMQETADLTADYLAYDAEWHANHNIHAATQGWTFPPPAHLSFAEYAARRAAGDNRA